MEQYELLRHAARCFNKHGIRYFVTGAVAAIAYGEPRLTTDIDIVADLSEDKIPKLKNCYPASEFHFDEEAAKRAVLTRSQFNIIHPGSGLKIDIMISQGDEFDRSRFRRARRLKPLDDTEVDFSSPEDVILKKMAFYRQGGSEKRLRDIAGILKISAGGIDFPYIKTWAAKLGLEEVWAGLSKGLSES